MGLFSACPKVLAAQVIGLAHSRRVARDPIVQTQDSPDMTDEIEFAATFARAIVDGDSNAAHEMLSADLGLALAATDLLSQFETLAEDMGGVTGVGTPMVILQEWPDMSPSDRAMIYVPLEGDVFSEAVTVTVSASDDVLCISGIEWGRP